MAVLVATTLSPGAQAAEPAKPEPVAQAAKKSPEQRYLEGLDCLRASDAGCAAAVLAGLNPASPYAKLLQAQIAAQAGDLDTPLRLLIPLQAERGLLPQAHASLHATLALAYEAQDNVLNALIQRVEAEHYLKTPETSADNQARIWKLLSAQPKASLVEMRGESPDPLVQGWLDLALSVMASDRPARGIEQWRAAYPDHPAGAELLAGIAGAEPAAVTVVPVPSSQRKIALLLPLDSPVYAGAARAVQSGFMAAYKASGGSAEVAVYGSGGAEGVMQTYRQAAAEGAQVVIGPLMRDEVTVLAGQALTVPVLALNQPEENAASTQPNLYLFGLPVEAEARQIARLGRGQGMQTALVVHAATPLGQRMAKAFAEEWRLLDGTVTEQLAIPDLDGLGELKVAAAAHPADLIFLGADAAHARIARPYLDQAIPTYGTSHIYDGAPKSVQNMDLMAVHFVDMPWILDPGNPEFTRFQPAEVAPGTELRRLYALGIDAYRLLAQLGKAEPGPAKLLDGATGVIRLDEQNALTRTMPLAQFRREGVVLEILP